MTIAFETTLDIDQIVANSYKDFHVKGFDYICIKRSPEETIKLYFFDGDVSKMPEVVAPHDHRYNFDTWVLAGTSENVWYKKIKSTWANDRDWRNIGREFNRFSYMTPLNGGGGFKFDGTDRLFEIARKRYGRNEECSDYGMLWHELHTIRIASNETVLMLRQYEDIVPLNSATFTYCLGDPPALGGLYSRFTPDEVLDKLDLFEDRTGMRPDRIRVQHEPPENKENNNGAILRPARQDR